MDLQQDGTPGSGGDISARQGKRLLWWVVGICVASALLAVASGFCIFVLWTEKLEKQQGWTFLAVLGAAALASFVIEYFRDIIRSGHAESLRLPRVLVTLVTLMMFELFILAWEALPEPGTAESWKQLPERLLGPALAGIGHVWLNLVVLIGLWMVSAIALACTLGVTIATGKPAATLKQQLAQGASRGVIAGALVAPIGAVAFVLLTRLVLAINAILFQHDLWRRNLDKLAHGQTDLYVVGYGPLRLVFSLFSWIDAMFHHGWWGPVVGIILLIAIGGFVISSKPNYFSVIIIVAAVAAVFGPILADLLTLLEVPLLAVVVWCVPGVLLGMAAPLLRRPSEHPREWGLVGLLGAIILLLATWGRFRGWWVLPLGLALIALVYFRHGVTIEEYWPVLACAVGITIFGATWVAQKATFAGILGKVHRLNSLPMSIPSQPAPAPDLRIFDKPLLTGTQGFGLPPASGWPTTGSSSRASFSYRDLLPGGSGAAATSAPTSGPSWWATTQPSLQPIGPSTPLLPESRDALWPPLAATQPRATTEGVGPEWTWPYQHHMPERKTHEHAERSEEDGEQEQAARRLELSLSGSLGFWTTVGLLATWALRRERTGRRHE